MNYNIIEKFLLNHIYEVLRIKEYIFIHPELAFHEYKSSEVIKQNLKKNGFSIFEVENINTAFIAKFGNGSPVIAILGEYDAVDGTNGPFHGCGHDLLASGSLLAALILKDFLESSDTLKGTIMFFGCPAEETGEGKVYMSENGAFKNVDIALTWHPHNLNYVNNNTTLTMQTGLYNFHGKSSHAGSTPFLGRSALDAAELMNVGANFLREHIPPLSQIQYSYINSGSTSPNVIPDLSVVKYMVRSVDLNQANEIFKRVDNVAIGASIMTGTTVEAHHDLMCKNIKINKVINKILYESLKSCLTYKKFKNYKLQSLLDKSLKTNIKPNNKVSVAFVSSDLGNVSQIVPTGQFFLASWVNGTEFHSTSVVAQNKEEYVNSSIINAALILADAAIKIYSEPSIYISAKKEMKE